jgi:tetratricopeptide (TPR) repeat protein
MLDLVDQLTAELLAGTLVGPNARLQKSAALTSESLEATKEFLRGEQLHREGLYREASDAYNRAIAIDSTFALAHYKKSIVNDYTDEPDDYDAAVKAVKYSGDLSPRDQSLIKALMDKRSGRHHAAEQAYRTHVLRYPDEVDALQQIGEILFHDNPRRGRPIGESRLWFERVLQFEPGNIEARLHLARLDALDQRFDELRQHAAFFREVAPNSERSIEVEAAVAYGLGDSTLQANVQADLRKGPWYFYAYAAMSSIQYARNPIGALEILDPYSGNEGLMTEMRAQVDHITGKYGAVRSFLSDERRARTASWDISDATMIEARVVDVDDRLIRSVLDRLEHADPAERRRTAIVPLHDIISVDVTEFERLWHMGQLHVMLGELREARDVLAQIRQTPLLPAMGTIQADAALALEAEILYSEGDRRGALAVLRRQVYDMPGPALWLAFSDGTRARFLRAELELEFGDIETAKALYSGFHGSYSAYDRLYVAVAYERLGRIAEIQDDVEAAIYNYGKFVETWRDCDPELIPARDAVSDRLDALLNRRARESAN